MPGAKVSDVCRHSENWTNGRRYTPLRHRSGVLVLTVVLCITSSKTKDGVTSWGKGSVQKKPTKLKKKNKTKNYYFQKDRSPTTAWITKVQIKQRGLAASKGRDLLLIHPLAPQLSDSFCCNHLERHQTCTLNSQKASSKGLISYDEQACPTKKYPYICLQNTGQTQELQALANTPWT